MARKSKEVMKKQQIALENSACIYRAVGYTRLSGDDIRHTNNTNTLKDQQLIVKEYINKQDDLKLCGMFSDNGVSGMTFNRPGFTAMLEGIREGKYNCVVVKDLSRFGRNHLEATYYLYKFFPENGIRFIAINNNYDSLQPNATTEEIVIPIMNLLNENYARDISKKVFASKRLNIEKGLFVNHYTPFGYKKSKSERGKLEIDKVAAPTVKMIFDAYVNRDMSMVHIARELNDKGIVSPAKYKYDTGIAKCKKWENAVWSTGIIRKILRNQVYIGSMVLGKTRTEVYKNKPTQTLPQEEWTVIPNSHEAIIPDKLFALAQEKLNLAAQTSQEKKHNPEYMFDNLYCGCCGSKLQKKRKHLYCIILLSFAPKGKANKLLL